MKLTHQLLTLMFALCMAVMPVSAFAGPDLEPTFKDKTTALQKAILESTSSTGKAIGGFIADVGRNVQDRLDDEFGSTDLIVIVNGVAFEIAAVNPLVSVAAQQAMTYGLNPANYSGRNASLGVVNGIAAAAITPAMIALTRDPVRGAIAANLAVAGVSAVGTTISIVGFSISDAIVDAVVGDD